MGKATALELAAEGAHVVVAARTETDLEAVVNEITSHGGQAMAHTMDVSKPSDVEQLAVMLEEHFEAVHILVNSAGEALIARLDETTDTDWDRLIDTNLKGPFLVIRSLLDLLRAADGALAVNIASKVGLTGHALVSVYTASKAGLIGLSRALAQELSGDKIRVVALCPGPVDTPMRWEATPDMEPHMTVPAKSVADVVLFLAKLGGRITTNEIVIEATTYSEDAVVLD